MSLFTPIVPSTFFNCFQMSISRKKHRDTRKIFQSSGNGWPFLICVTFVFGLCHELTPSEMLVTMSFLWKGIEWKPIQMLSLVENIVTFLHIWPTMSGLIFAIKCQKSRIFMLQMFSFIDASNLCHYCDLRNISRVWCALSVNNFKTAAMIQLAHLKFPSLDVEPL